jgi:hypothetical protein
VKRGIIRRQGDLGNGYQQAETVNSIILCAGVDDNVPGTLKIMPRLPENWSVKITDYPVIVYSEGLSYISKIDLKITYPENGVQTLALRAFSGGDLKNVNFRMGPFNAEIKSIKVSINGEGNHIYPCFISGDKAWIWIKITEIKVNSQITVKTQK